MPDRLVRWRQFVCALLLGAVTVAGFAPLAWFPVAIATLAGLAYLLDEAQRARHGFLIGFGWGLGCFLAGISWLYVALNRYGGVPMPLAALAILLFCAYLALFPAIAAMAFVRFRQGGGLQRALLFAALWAFSELLRGWLFTGFPWLSLGYTQTPPSPLSGFFPLLGVYGVGFIATLIAALLALTNWRNAAKSAATLAGVVVIALSGWLFSLVEWTTPDGEPLRVALVQTNIEQNLKWAPERLDDWLEVNARLVRGLQADLVVLPETTLPLLEEQLPAGYLDYLTTDLRERGGDLLFGIFSSDSDGRVYNSAVSHGASAPQIYAKRHLVPFGEYSPPLFGWFYRIANIPMSDQTPGKMHRPLLLGQQQVAVNICYEDLFGRELLAALPEATLMLNLSNLAWYGDSLAQPQHLQIATARALETGRPMLRSTNTGMTALVLPDGRTAEVLPPFERGVLQADIRGYRGMTPYALWGDWAIAILIVSALLAGGWRRSRQPG